MAAGAACHYGLSCSSSNLRIMTVNGPLSVDKTGFTLIHEHVLVDFGGAKNYDPSRWDTNEVASLLLPFLIELKQNGYDTFFEYTPAYLGRDPILLQQLSRESGLNMVTNTGFYGAVNNKYLPELAFEATPEELAAIWIDEFEQGIGNTGIRPGFIKISVNPEPLSDLHQKLVHAAALTHLKTGLTIASHTGPAIPAFEQLDILKKFGVHPSAFVWVHAQNELDHQYYIKAARAGAWVSLDGIQQDNVDKYAESLQLIKEQQLLNKVLISQDAGWYEPGKPWEGLKRMYTDISNYLIPKLKEIGFTDKNIRQLTFLNPGEAFAIRVREY